MSHKPTFSIEKPTRGCESIDLWHPDGGGWYWTARNGRGLKSTAAAMTPKAALREALGALRLMGRVTTSTDRQAESGGS